jgi:hypothetical protein
MIIFIIPLISKQVSSNWDLTTKLLQGTLDSIANQSDQNFKVIISCHEIPNVQLKQNSERLSFLQMEYAPLEELNRSSGMHDKGIKCCHALKSLENCDFSYCMVVDADDRLHKNLVSFLNSEQNVDGWIIDKGYQVDYYSSRCLENDKLSNICGSTVIVSSKIALNTNQFSLEESIIYFTDSQGHNNAKKFFYCNNLILKYLPFNGVQYIVNHELNDSNKFKNNKIAKFLKNAIKYYLLGRNLSNEEYSSFGYFLSK